MENLFEQIRKEFFTRLEEKTGWGKEQLKVLYLECQVKVLGNALAGTPNEPLPTKDSELPREKEVKAVPTDESALDGEDDGPPWDTSSP